MDQASVLLHSNGLLVVSFQVAMPLCIKPAMVSGLWRFYLYDYDEKAMLPGSCISGFPTFDR